MEHKYMIRKIPLTMKMKPMRGEMDSLVSWKHQADKFADSDNTSGMGDQNTSFNEFGSGPTLTGSQKGVSFISKDETNVAAMRRMKMKRWF